MSEQEPRRPLLSGPTRRAGGGILTVLIWGVYVVGGLLALVVAILLLRLLIGVIAGAF